MTLFLLAAVVSGIAFYNYILVPAISQKSKQKEERSPNSAAEDEGLNTKLIFVRVQSILGMLYNALGPIRAAIMAICLGVVLLILMNYIYFLFHIPESKFDYIIYILDYKIQAFIVKIYEYVDLRAVIFGIMFGVSATYIIFILLNDNIKQINFTNSVIVMCLFLSYILLGVGDLATLEKVGRSFGGGGVKLPGGLEFTLAQPTPDRRSSDTSLATIVPPRPGPAGGHDYAAPEFSGGLMILRDMPEAVRRDALYYALKKGLYDERNGPQSGPINDRTIENLINMAEVVVITDRTVGTLARCLVHYVALYGADQPVAEALRPSATALRTLLVNENSPLISAYEAPLWAVVIDKFVGVTAIINRQLSTEVAECVALQRALTFSERDSAKLREYLTEEGTFDRPYLWSIAAAALAYNHEYASALQLLDQWIRRSARLAEKKKNDQNSRNDTQTRASKTNADQDLRAIHEIRIRSQIAAYIEEWISYQPQARTRTVLDYHRENLLRTIEVLEKLTRETRRALGFLIGDSEQEAHSDYSCGRFSRRQREWSKQVQQILHPYDYLDSDGKQTAGEDYLSVGRMELSLVQTLLSLKWTWIDAVLLGDSEEYIGKYSAVAQSYATELYSLDLACMATVNQRDAHYAPLLRAKNLNAYARVKRAEALLSVPPQDREQQLKAALAVALKGHVLASPAGLNEGERQGSTFLERVAGTDAAETLARLDEIKRQIEDDLRR